jgi:DNA-binding response OmpR family regulator
MILVVEDNKALRIMIKKVLEREGYSVKVAINGKEGLSLLRDETPDLIISDVIMPEMDGLAFLKEVRKKHPFIPFTLLTVKSELDDYLRGYEFGATDYMTKPFEMDTLIKRVDKRLKSYKSIKEIVNGKEESFSLDKVNLVDLFHTLKENKIACTINISSPLGNGTFKIDKGKIKKCEFAGLKGKDAISKVTGLKSGDVSVKQGKN